MFLSMLNEKLKPKFLQLAINAANANGNFDNIEKQLISVMASEMNIESDIKISSSDESLLSEIISCSSETERRIMLFETIAILYSDDKIEEDETRFLYRIASSFDIDHETLSTMITYISDYKRLYIDISNLLLMNDNN